MEQQECPPHPHSGRPCSSEGPRVEPDGRNAAWMWLYWEKGRRFALACAWVLNHTKEPQPGLGIYLDYGGQSSWRVGFSFHSDPGLLSWGKKKSPDRISVASRLICWILAWLLLQGEWNSHTSVEISTSYLRLPGRHEGYGTQPLSLDTPSASSTPPPRAVG